MKKNLTHFLPYPVLLLFFFLFAGLVQAQITVTPNASASALIDRLAGSGITYLNPQLTCPNNASGKFDNGMASSVLIDSGIVLTTGLAKTSGSNFGVNGLASDFASVNNNTNGGDNDLATAASTAASNLHDLCKLEFDFVPTGDTIQFRYRFGSEEYPEYNCTNFNDIFAFFISGPGYPTPTNVALVPGTNIPVSINSINNGTIVTANGGALSTCNSMGAGSPFTAYYVNTSSSTTITYDGLTTLLTAKAAVTPCSTYHMKFAIADKSDHIYDSGVFLEAGSFSSDIASVTNVTSSNSLSSTNPFAMEGCTAAVITISRPSPKPFPQIVTYTLGGSATNGVDVSVLSGSVTIPANATSATITVNALADAITEGTETLIFNINGSLCGGSVTEVLTMEIQEFPHFTVSNDDTLCAGQSATLSAIPSPANPNVGFSWTPAGSLNTSSGSTVVATPGTTTTYTVSASFPGCSAVDSTIQVTVDPLPTLNLTSVNASCNGLNNGSITASGSVGIGPLSFQLSPGSLTAIGSPHTFSGLAIGVYTVTISSGSGCTQSATKTITQPTVLNWNTVSSQNPSCNGVTNGSLTATVSGGSGVITYTLMPGAASNTNGIFSSLGTGLYTVTAVDANGCSTTTNISLTSATAIGWTQSTATPAGPCNGSMNGSIQVLASGGTGLLTYTLMPSSLNNTTGVFGTLPAGNYIITVSDANNCTSTTSLTVTQPSPVQMNSLNSSPALCYGTATGSVTANASGGTGAITYQLIPGSLISVTGIFSSLVAGTYTVIASDASGCSQSSSTTITQPNILQWNTSTSSPVSCYGGSNGSIVVHAIGGTGSLQYTLNPGAISNGSGNFSSLNSGTYTLQVVDANACSITTVLTVGTPPVLSISAGTAVPVSCYNGSNGQLSCSASGGNGGYTYTLNPGSVSNTTGIFTGLTAGTYSMSVSDILGCSQTLVATVSQPASLQIASINWVHPSCSSVNNGSITWSAGGGTPSYQYALNSGIFASLNTFNGLAGGMYTLHIKDNNNCVKDTQIQLIPQYAVTLNNILTQDILCKGDSSGSLSVTGAGGVFPYSYSLNGTAMGTVSNYTALPAGNYLVYVQDINGCSDDTLLQLLEPASGLGFNSVNILPVFCYGDQTGALTGFGLGGTAPYSFSLNGAPFQTSGTFSNLFAGNYTLQIRDANNCIHDTLLQVTQPSNPLFLYLKSLKDVSCVGKSDGELNTGCTGGTAPYQYFINGTAHGNDSTFLFLNAGTYTIEVKDVNGCSTSKLFIIGTPANNPIIVVNEIKENRCKADITGMIDWYALYGTPPYQFTFNGIFQDSVSNASNLFTGSYLIELKDKNGCQTDTTVSIRSSSDLNVTVQASPASCSGDGNDGKALASVSGGFSPYEYFWSGALTTGSSLNGIPQGSHSLVVKDMENCLDTAFYSIDYIPCCEVSMPNAFSPNNDGVNDIFRPVLYGIIELKSFEVYNRWGNCLFQTHQLLDGWNGIYSGSDCEIGTYYYLLSYYCQFSKEIQIKKGDFTLLR